MKEASQLKGTHATPANAMAASAVIFDSLAEVDAKFSKICEKEYEAMSAELKKWFKKMAKEEKNYDDLAFNTNNRIKQASLTYEKKARGKARDASEEHTRYVNTLTTLGNELAQAKLTHATFITQRHTATLFSVGGTMSRLADAEWVRACEQVRRCSGDVGKVGEWRMYCEGGWQYAVPGDLLDIEREDPQLFSSSSGPRPDGRSSLQVLSSVPNNFSTSSLAQEPSPLPSPAIHSITPRSPTGSLPVAPSLWSDNSIVTLPQVIGHRPGNSGSLPASVVLPPPSPAVNHSPTVKFVDEIVKNQSKSDPNFDPPAPAPNPEPPFFSEDSSKVDQDARERQDNPDTSAKGSLGQRSPEQTAGSMVDEQSLLPTPAASELSRWTGPSQPQSTRDNPLGDALEQSGLASSENSVVEEKQSRSSARAQAGYNVPSDRRARNMGRSISIDSTLSNGSHVAALRERYSERNNNPTSPPPRDLPRLPQTVTNLAQRYAPNDAPSGRMGPPSSFNGSVVDKVNTGDRERFASRRTSFESDRDRDRDRVRERDYHRERERERLLSTPRRSRDWAESGDISDDKDRERIRRRRQEEMEWDEREQELRDRERRLDRQQKELDREKERIIGSKGLQPPHAENDRSGYSPKVPMSHAIRSDKSSHASSCGCYDCSVKQYSTTSPPPSVSDRSRLGNDVFSSSSTSLSQHAATQPNIRPQPTHAFSQSMVGSVLPEKEKKGTWMGKNLRRLSMPIGAAFSSDSSRSSPATLVPPIPEGTRLKTYDERPGNGLGIASLRR
ncbi:hypothetical protein FRC02_003459 [Tulasnella sp. 418]|nr:hypothetical protein FRC02_003459 [Tulasnella sp. 418]